MTQLDVTQDPYNAVPDGESDSREAIQQAINDAQDGDVVYIPAGDYLLASDSPENGEWGSLLTINDDKNGQDFTIEGDGPNSVLLAGESENMLAINPGGNGSSDTIAVTVRNLVLDGNDYTADHGVDIYQGLPDDRSSGNDIHFEDVLIQHTGDTGFQMSGDDLEDFGISTVTATNLTVKDTNDGHGISTNSYEQTTNRSEITNVFNSIKVLDIGSSGANDDKGTGFNFDGSCLFQNFVVEDCTKGIKISGGQSNPILENGRLQNFLDTDQWAIRETVAGDWPEPYSMTFDNVVVESMAGGCMRLESDGNVDIGTMVFKDIQGDNGYNSDEDVVWLEENVDFTADVIHVCGSEGEILTTSWDGDGANIGELNYDSSFGGLSGEFTADTANEVSSCADLGVPTKDEVGAFSGSGGSIDDGEEEETDSGEETEETPQSPLFDDWTPQWDSSQNDWRVVSGSEYVGEYALAFEHDGTDRTRYALAWDQLGELADVEIVDKFRVPEFTSDSNLGFHSRVHLRSSGSSGSESGYWIEADTPQDAFRLAKYTNGDLTTLDRFGTPEENTFFYRRFRAEGTQLKAKVWPVGESEPSAWDIETTDEDHASGWVGLGSFDTELAETDLFSVATGGETAPLPGVESPDNAPTLSWVSPADGVTVSGSTTVQIDASDAEDDAGSLLVEYRADDGSWTAASYNTETGYYEGSWDTTTVSDGDHSLEASVTDSAGNTANAAITVTTDNASGQPSIETLSLSEVETDSSDAEFDATWQISDSDGDLATADLVLFQDSDGSREDELSVDISGEAASETTRLVASGDDGSANSYTVELTVTDGNGNTASGSNSTTESEDSGTAPVINRFNVSEAGRPDPHARVTALWDVTATDGDLETVDIEVADSNGTVQGVSWTVSGVTASDADSFKIKEGDGQSFDVTITVTNASGKSSSETKSVSA